MEEVTKLRDETQRLDGLARDCERKYQDLSNRMEGLDVDAARAAIEEKARLEAVLVKKDPAKEAESYERQVQKFREEADGKIRSLTEQLEKTSRLNTELAVTDKVLSKISGRFTDDGLKLLKRVVQERCDLDDDGAIVVTDKSGEALYKGARPMAVDEWAGS